LEQKDFFPCPSCGAGMRFNIDKQALVCEYCSNTKQIAKDTSRIKEYDISLAEEYASRDWGEKTKIIKCKNCGAETVIKANETAQFCAFCNSSYVFNMNEASGIRPEAVVPFKISINDAKQRFSKWVNKKWLAPKAFKSVKNTDKFKGVYIPYWTYDSNTASNYTAQRGTYYYVTKIRNVKNPDGSTRTETYQERHTRWEGVSGTYSSFFNDILVNGSNKNTRLLNMIEPFNLKELMPYKAEYLSGFFAERYSVGLEDGWGFAKKVMSQKIQNNIMELIGGDQVKNLCFQTQYSRVTFKHLLLPVWISAYQFRKKVFHFFINGQTGEVQGEWPISAWKFAASVLLGLFIFAGIVYIIGLNIQ